MKKKYLALTGILLTSAMITLSGCGDSTGQDSAKKEEVKTEAVSEKEEAEVEEAETKEETDKDQAETSAAQVQEPASRPSYDFSEYVKKLGVYEGLTAEVSPLGEVTEDMIKTEIDTRLASEKEVLTEGKVEMGDIANIDYVGKKDDVAFDGGTAAGYDLTIGSGQFIPGFEDGLVGAKIGDTVDLNLSFPENYQAPDLAGAEVVFTVTVNSVQRSVEFSDEMAEKLSDGKCKDMKSYEETVKEDLEEIEKDKQKAEAESAYWELILNDTEFNELPEDVLTYDVDTNVTYYRNMLQYYYGMTLEDYCAMDGSTVEEYEAQIRENMELNFKYELIEQAILEAEGIEMNEDIYNEYSAKYAEQAGYDLEAFFKIANEWDIWKSIYYEKSSEIISGKNTFTEKK